MTNKIRQSEKVKLYANIVIAVLLSLSVLFMPACAEENVYTNAVRLHVVANSDNEDDQSVKLKVRNEILKEIGRELGGMKNETSSYDYLKENKDYIEKIASDTLLKHGYEYGASVNVGIHTYPTRMYEEATLPAGEYKSVQVILGEGEGKNWWCVVYPPMCLGVKEIEIEDIFLDEDLTEEESLVVKSWILEYFNKETPQPNEKAKNRLLNWLNKLGG